tara:strand:+ start:248 stop:499 length:252 start_codon:yes stop_codon:yes gene_type:complete
MRNPYLDLNSKMRKIHKVAMECVNHLVKHEGFDEDTAAKMVTDYMKELNEGGVFKMGHKVVITHLKMIFMDVSTSEAVMDMIK